MGFSEIQSSILKDMGLSNLHPPASPPLHSASPHDGSESEGYGREEEDFLALPHSRTDRALTPENAVTERVLPAPFTEEEKVVLAKAKEYLRTSSIAASLKQAQRNESLLGNIKDDGSLAPVDGGFWGPYPYEGDEEEGEDINTFEEDLPDKARKYLNDTTIAPARNIPRRGRRNQPPKAQMAEPISPSNLVTNGPQVRPLAPTPLMHNTQGPLSKEGVLPPKTGDTKGSPWKNLFATNRSSVPLEYIKPGDREIGTTVRIKPPKDVADAGLNRWKDCLVGYFLDKKLPYTMVQNFAIRNWQKSGTINISSNGQGFFIFRFSDCAAKEAALDSSRRRS